MTETAARPPIWVRVLFVVVALAAWFATQRLIGQRELVRSGLSQSAGDL